LGNEFSYKEQRNIPICCIPLLELVIENTSFVNRWHPRYPNDSSSTFLIYGAAIRKGLVYMQTWQQLRYIPMNLWSYCWLF